ncbi:MULTISPECIES: hypothetical protein [Eikenella]|uniref:Uncharacterized protein n=1 Tax=Eikenella longinqua TaxID=1795827 RepID=A0A1A9RWL3_9NEIS|nr:MULTISPECIES: hypothetical protein [Eikenella]OAM29047.1 hypothetical protein A7P95_04745 [Eikenella longinqua]
MKKTLFAAALLAAVLAPAASAKTVQQMRSEFVSSCVQSATSGGSTLNRSMATTLCGCTFDETAKQYPAAQWKRTLEQYDRTGNDPVFERRMRASTETCVRRHVRR